MNNLEKSGGLQSLFFVLKLMENREYDAAEKHLKQHIVAEMKRTIIEYTNANSLMGGDLKETLEDALKSIQNE